MNQIIQLIIGLFLVITIPVVFTYGILFLLHFKEILRIKTKENEYTSPPDNLLIGTFN